MVAVRFVLRMEQCIFIYVKACEGSTTVRDSVLEDGSNSLVAKCIDAHT